MNYSDEKKPLSSAYERAVNDTTYKSRPFVSSEISYYLKYNVTALDKECVDKHSQTIDAPKGCRECNKRFAKFIALADADGKPAFLCGKSLTEDEHASNPMFNLTYNLAAEIIKRENSIVEPLVVTCTTFPSILLGGYCHPTIFPTTITSETDATRCLNLEALWGAKQIDSRLSKLLEPDAMRSMQVIFEETKRLVRSNHWKSVCTWVRGLMQKMDEFKTQSFDNLTEEQKIEFRFFAVMTGRVDGRVHLDYQQSSNLIDFLTVGCREELRKIMDARSDPASYMMSALVKRLEDEGVTNPRTISLAWSSPDDLDLHVYTDHNIHIFYNNKENDGCKLDIDANFTKIEINPIENTSVRTGKFRICVDNYTRRTFDKPIQFTIICREVGKPDAFYPGAWTQDMCKGVQLEVCTYTFGTSIEKKGYVMSDNAAARTLAQNKDWENRVGTPVSTIATLETLPPSQTVVNWGMGVIMVDGNGYIDKFMAMALTTKARSQNNDEKKKSPLWKNCQRNPTTFGELIALLQTGDHELIAHGRDFTPGYLTNITTIMNTRKDDLPICNSYEEKYRHPVKPIKGTIGTARFDNTWNSNKGNDTYKTLAFVYIRGLWFAVFEDAVLPNPLVFPIGGGFYPVDLSADFHQHRERWTFYHTTLRPVMPVLGTPLVGSFLVGANATFTLDGQEITVMMD